MAAADEEDAWGPPEPADAGGGAAAVAAGPSGRAALGAHAHAGARPFPSAPAAAAAAPAASGAAAPRVIAQQEVARLWALQQLRLSPAPPPPPAPAAAARINTATSAGGAAPSTTGPLPLRALALGAVARHVSELASAAGPTGCPWLPADAKASLIAAARRRGELTDEVLLALVDESLTVLDLSGSRVTGAGLLAALQRAPRLRALDLRRCGGVSAGGLRRAAALCPRLALLRLGGSPACDGAAAAALPKIVPAISPGAVLEDDGGSGLQPGGGGVSDLGRGASGGGISAVGVHAGAPGQAAVTAVTAAPAADSWEDLAASSSGDEGGALLPAPFGAAAEPGHSGGGGGPCPAAVPSPGMRRSGSAGSGGGGGGPGGGGRLRELRVVVFPEAPRETRLALERLCPRVILNPVPPPADGGGGGGGRSSSSGGGGGRDSSGGGGGRDSSGGGGGSGAALLLGGLPPEVDPAVALDAAAFEAVGPAALEGVGGPAAPAPGAAPGPSVAERFRQAYVDRGARLRAREARLAWLERRRAARDELRRSGGARQLAGWLDEM